ncbi:MAG: RNA-binding protein [Candidatus Bathyarchaeia archaeon]
MTQRYRRHFLKEKDAKAVLREVSERLNVNLEENFKTKVNVEVVETEFAEIFLINGKPLLAKAEGKAFPTLIFNEIFPLTSKVVVDMGAVPHVCNGANVMAPGIVGFDGNFRKGDYVLIVDERHRKPIAVGEALYDAVEAKNVKQGIVVKNMHFISDRIWNFIKKLAEKAE